MNGQSQDHEPTVTAVASGQSHTPGPWEWARCDDGDYAFLKGDGLYVLSPENVPGAAAWVDVSEADARLIAAAPALLEAADGVLDMLDNWVTTQWLAPTTGERWKYEVERLRAALAKAEPLTSPQDIA